MYVNHALDTIGIEGMLKLMEDVADRYCKFRECLAYYDGDTMKFFHSKFPGRISDSIRGMDHEEKWSDLWYIFIPDKFNKTLAEFDQDDFAEYDRVEQDSCISKFGIWYEEK